jgi:hypothetical protein
VTAADGSRPRIHFGQPSGKRSGPPPLGVLGSAVGAVLLALVVGTLAWSALSGRPPAAAHPDLFGGSVVLGDTRPLTVIDVATAQITVRLEGVDTEVGAANYADVQPVAVAGGTMLVNRVSGSFNFLEADDYVTDPDGAGVGLGPLAGSTGAEGVPSGADAYILRAGAHSTVSLVGQSTVAEAARAEAGSAAANPTGRPRVTVSPAAALAPIGFAALGGPADLGPGGAAAQAGDLWVLSGGGAGCRLRQLHPVPTSRQGLTTLDRGGSVAPCGRDSLEPSSGEVAFAQPGRVLLLPAGGRPGPAAAVTTPFTDGASRILPVTGSVGHPWFLAEVADRWVLFGVGATKRPVGPFPLTGLGPGSDPVTPVLAGSFLYTLDQTQPGQPTLWTIDVANGRMAPLTGVPAYPALSAAEKDRFIGAQVLLVGPRVVINNPGSLEAVVVFTDGSHPPVVVDKSQAVAVSTTGPADLNVHTPTTTRPGSERGGKNAPAPAASRAPVPVVEPVSQEITCADTTQKPYAPQITTVSPSSGGALVQWSYQLLDQTDCEPDSWAVSVTALTGGHQPAQPVHAVYGQSQYLLTGLRPATTYQVVVTAYINAQSTASTPATFATTARGPDAPLSVTTTSDGAGDWVVSWTPCTPTASARCVVPADQWTVTGAACGGSFVGTPPTVQVAGDQDRVTLNATNLGELGDQLSFSVQGSLFSGLTGDPTSDGSCTEAYQKPDAGAISLSGTGAATTGGTVTATLEVAVTGGTDPTTAFGSQPTETEFVYDVDGMTVGPTSRTTVTVPGLPPGVDFTPTVRIYPAGHPEAAVTVAGASFHQTLAWPADLQGGTTVAATVDPDPNQGSFTVDFPPDLPSGPLSATSPDPAESAAGPELQCGGSGGAVETYPVQAVSGGHLDFPVSDLIDNGGSCTVSFQLTDNASPDPYGGPSGPVTVPFQIGQAPAYSFTQGFTQQCQQDDTCGPPVGPDWQLLVSSSDPSLAAGGDWSVTAEVRDRHSGGELPGDPCYISQGVSSSEFPYTVDLPPTCPYSLLAQVDVVVSYKYIGQTTAADAGLPDNSPGSPAQLPPPPPPTTTTTIPTTTTTAAGSTTVPTTTVASTTVAPTTAAPRTAARAGAAAGAGGGGASPAALGAWALGAVGLGGAASARRRGRGETQRSTTKGIR